MAELDEIGVVARVAPEDKVRLVRLLKEKGNVVAMTGDGVNDAPALKTADIGVAMGITGTEVSKEAAVMILTDDNFATIVGAVSYGRTLYDNLLKYLRFQMSTLVAYIAIFIGAGIIGIANGAPLNPLQILWLNMVVDIPLAIALGFDQPATRPDGPPAAPGRSAGALAQQLDPAVRPGRGDDRRRAGRLPDRRRPGRRRRRPRRCCSPRCRCSTWPRRCCAATSVNTIFDRDAIPGVMQLRRYGIALLAIIADHRARLPPADLRHHRPHLHPVVHLHRHRRLARRRRGADQARPPPPDVADPQRPTPAAARDPRHRLSKGSLPCRSTSATAASSRSSTSRPTELRFLLKLSADLKAAKYGGYEQPRLAGKDIALIFEKTSTRTRTAFEVAAKDQGAHVTYLEPSGSQIGHKESMKDTARVLGRTFDGIEYRGFAQENGGDARRATPACRCGTGSPTSSTPPRSSPTSSR